MKSSTRIIVNTGVQYFRSIISIIVTLYTARLVLLALGVDDFGIYSLVGGVISLLSFIQNSLARAIQRFLSYFQGKEDDDSIFKVFNNSIITQLFISILLIIILFSLTEPIFDRLIKISSERENAAKIVYWVMIGSLFFQSISTPYLAVLIARENIVYSSIVQIIDAFIKIPVALSLYWIGAERLIWYSIMIMGLSIINFLFYYIYTTRKYWECQNFSLKSFNWRLTKEMLSFMSFTIYGTFCVATRQQGLAVILNRFYSTAINTAYGISNQIIGQLSFLCVAISTAVTPQIVKSEGKGDRQRMFRLAEISAKFSLLLLTMILVPVYFYLDFLLKIWLSDVPDYTIMFCHFTIIISILDWTTQPLNSVNGAVGNVKKYTLLVYSLALLVIPFAYIVLRLGYGAYGAMMTYVIIVALTSVSRLEFLHYDINLSIKQYLRHVFFRSIPVITINCAVCYIFRSYLQGWWCIAAIILSILITVILTLIIGLEKDEKQIIKPWIIRTIRLLLSKK